MTAVPKKTEAAKPASSVHSRYWSYSRLSMFRDCERQFYYKYVLGLPYPSNHSMRVGKIFHRAIELMIREGYSSSEALYFSIGEQEGLPEGEKTYYLLGMLNKAFDRIPKMDYLEISSELDLSIKTTKGVIKLIIDLVIDDPANDVTYLWDFKTSWSSFSAETHMQLPFYGWLYKQYRGYVGSTFKGKLVFPRLDKSEDNEVLLTDEKLEKARLWLIQTITLIEAKDPDDQEDWKMAKDRSKCDYCPYAARCAGGLLAGLSSTGEPRNLQEAEKIGEYLLSQELALKNMKSGFKKWVEENQSVHVGTGVWMIEQKPSAKCEDVDALIDFAQRNGLDLKKALNPKPAILAEWLLEDETGELEQLISYSNGRKSFKYVK